MIASLPLPFPFELTFMQRALAAGLVVGVFAPLIGTFLVQKRMSLIGDGIGHVAFAGVGAGLLAGIYPVWTALVFAVAGALGIEWLRARRKASGDLALALFFYSGIALGAVFANASGGIGTSIIGFLFGQPLTVGNSEVIVILLLGSLVVGLVIALRRILFAVVTDEDWSGVAGLPVGGVNALLAVLTAVAIVASMQIVGILLIAALMVLPVATGQLLARSFKGTLRIAVGVGVGSVVVGLTSSRLWGLAPGGAIVLVAALVFLIVALARHTMPGGSMLELPER
ncbi:MAG TPA: metal ABC transporter permease [Actinomycetota bacterium]|nr:metal ABC transporter permease [Actinomycetota bacterium]